jgi:PXA domain
MTAPLPLPPHLQPASKSSSIAKSTHLSAVADSSPTTSRSSSQARPLRPRQNANSPEYTSAKATATLIRRVLGPQTTVDPRSSPRTIEDILPPLTSSNEVDLQLYAIIAIVVKDFVQVWYSKITPDHVFVEEVVHIIAHCSRAVEQRLRRIDVEELIFDEIPALVEAHILGKNIHLAGCRRGRGAFTHGFKSIQDGPRDLSAFSLSLYPVTDVSFPKSPSSAVTFSRHRTTRSIEIAGPK